MYLLYSKVLVIMRQASPSGLSHDSETISELAFISNFKFTVLCKYMIHEFRSIILASVTKLLFGSLAVFILIIIYKLSAPGTHSVSTQHGQELKKLYVFRMQRLLNGLAYFLNVPFPCIGCLLLLFSKLHNTIRKSAIHPSQNSVQLYKI